MPMLDVCDWLLLPTVSSTTMCGGTVPPFLFCGISLLPPGCFPWTLCWGSIIVMALNLLMVVGVEKLCCVVCCQCWPASSAVLNQHSLDVLCTIVRILFLARAGRIPFEWPPRMTYRHANSARSDARMARAVFTQNCGCCQQPMRTVAISPLLLSSSPK